MIYNFAGLDSGSDSESVEETPAYVSAVPDEERKRAEIERLEAIRDEKRKELLYWTKSIQNKDDEHQLQVKEMSKEIMKLSRAADEQRKIAAEKESYLKTLPVNGNEEAAAKNQSIADAQAERIRVLRTQTDSLKTDIQKAKRVLVQEGGCKNRAQKIKKLEAMLEDLPRVSKEDPCEFVPPKTPNGMNIDVQALRSEIGDLTKENESLKLKLKGLRSRVTTLEKDGLKDRVKANLIQSEKNDEEIERLRPKQRRRPIQEKFRDHVGQQSRLAVIILGLHAELAERNKELNHGEVASGEAGISREIARLQKRMHLLESSMSCVV